MGEWQTGDVMDDAGYDRYCAAVEGSPVWGGNLELQALSAALRRAIHVHQASGLVHDFGAEFADGPGALHLVLHQLRCGARACRPTLTCAAQARGVSWRALQCRSPGCGGRGVCAVAVGRREWRALKAL